MSGVKIIKIKSEDDGMRLNRWFLREYPGLSLARLQKLLRTKQIKVDGKRAETSTKLVAGQEMRLPPLDNEKISDERQRSSFEYDESYVLSLVLYKNKDLIAINKPSGLAVQGGSGTVRHVDGMLDALKFENDERPKLVHRIDKDTSGVLILARNRKSAELLTKAFREKNLHKTYLALVRGCPSKKSGEIKAPLEKNGEKMAVLPQGKPAVTSYHVLDEVGKKFALVEASPLTGRTHQIRAHLEYIGCPIVGDSKYFGEKRERIAGLKDKLYLHAYKIDLSEIYNKKLVISAPVPEYFHEAFQTLGIEFKE